MTEGVWAGRAGKAGGSADGNSSIGGVGAAFCPGAVVSGPFVGVALGVLIATRAAPQGRRLSAAGKEDEDIGCTRDLAGVRGEDISRDDARGEIYGGLEVATSARFASARRSLDCCRGGQKERGVVMTSATALPRRPALSFLGSSKVWLVSIMKRTLTGKLRWRGSSLQTVPVTANLLAWKGFVVHL